MNCIDDIDFLYQHFQNKYPVTYSIHAETREFIQDKNHAYESDIDDEFSEVWSRIEDSINPN
jgi:hypothetical protein